MASPSNLRQFMVPALALGLAISALACEPENKKEGGKVTDTTATTIVPASILAPSTTATTAAPTTTTTAKAVTTTTAKPVTTTTAKPVSTVSFANCTEAKAAGYRDIRRGQPGYASHLDRDNDGIACES